METTLNCLVVELCFTNKLVLHGVNNEELKLKPNCLVFQRKNKCAKYCLHSV